MPSKNTLFAILQQAEYDLKYFSQWYEKNKSEIINPKSEIKIKWTSKLKLINFFYALLPSTLLGINFLSPLQKIKISLVIIKPFEFFIRQFIYAAATAKLLTFKLLGLKVVAIAGSYAKTSTKHILYHSLKSQVSMLITPESVNTPLGIARVILKDLKPEHKLFVAELGEYYRGDISKLCRFTRPNFGILTPIGRQHLERMGSLEVIVATFTELLEYFKFDSSKLLIASENEQYFGKHKLNYYGLKKKDQKLKNKNILHSFPRDPFGTFFILHSFISRSGTEFTVKLPDQELKVFSPLYGEHQAANTLPAFWLAQKLKLNSQLLNSSITQLPFIPHRHQPFFTDNDVLILDNGYNSNPDSVQASLELINALQPTHRIVITPGFLELGTHADELHFLFGKQLAKKTDYLGLLNFPGQQKIIEGFIKAGGKKTNIFTGNSQAAVIAKLQSKIIKGSVILFENGVNEVYR